MALPPNRFFVLTSSGELGPLDPSGVRKALNEKRIQSTDRVRTSSGKQFGTVVQFLENASRTTGELSPVTASTSGVRPRPQSGELPPVTTPTSGVRPRIQSGELPPVTTPTSGVRPRTQSSGPQGKRRPVKGGRQPGWRPPLILQIVAISLVGVAMLGTILWLLFQGPAPARPATPTPAPTAAPAQAPAPEPKQAPVPAAPAARPDPVAATPVTPPPGKMPALADKGPQVALPPGEGNWFNTVNDSVRWLNECPQGTMAMVPVANQRFTQALRFTFPTETTNTWDAGCWFTSKGVLRAGSRYLLFMPYRGTESAKPPLFLLLRKKGKDNPMVASYDPPVNGEWKAWRAILVMKQDVPDGGLSVQVQTSARVGIVEVGDAILRPFSGQELAGYPVLNVE